MNYQLSFLFHILNHLDSKQWLHYYTTLLPFFLFLIIDITWYFLEIKSFSILRILIIENGRESIHIHLNLLISFKLSKWVRLQLSLWTIKIEYIIFWSLLLATEGNFNFFTGIFPSNKWILTFLRLCDTMSILRFLLDQE